LAVPRFDAWDELSTSTVHIRDLTFVSVAFSFMLTVLRRACFHTSNHLFPIGYHAFRLAESYSNPGSRILYNIHDIIKLYVRTLICVFY
jgi:hypothetical protein